MENEIGIVKNTLSLPKKVSMLKYRCNLKSPKISAPYASFFYSQSQDVVGNAMKAMSSTGSALLDKQMEGEKPVDVSGKNLEMKVSLL